MNEELQEWWRNRRHSPSALSHRSRDSGFSDSDAGPAQRPASPTAKPEKQTPSGQQRVRRTRASRERPESVTHTCTEPTETATRTCGNAESLDPGGDRPQATQFGDVESYWTDNSELTARYVGSCEDLSHMPPPTHASTPKSARSCRPGTKHRVDINR
ncbi:hypothetical protein AAG570_013108 [Ranatra chinensis]|uniref:Uncharacterized protein n=1 Tax=Ranatra chinensis TaxID=642074 RepID=A0ABD0YFU8_9HEMI